MKWFDVIKNLGEEPKRRKPKHKRDLTQQHRQKLSTEGKVKETEEKKCPPGERWDDEAEECVSIEEWIKRQPSLEDMQWNSGNLTKNDEDIEAQIVSVLREEGGAAGLDAIVDGVKTKRSDKRIKRILLNMSNVKEHKDGDFILTEGL